MASPGRRFLPSIQKRADQCDRTASFASEQLDLTIDPESKGFRVIALRSPLYVRGTFKSPQAGVKAGPLIVRGAVAAALATLVTPAAALLALDLPGGGR